MYRLCCSLLLIALTVLQAADENIVFRSDVALVRVDAQVVDRNSRAITGLQREDFVLLQGGKEREIRNFANEDMPVDVVLLLDVSGSMQSHIERLSSAAHQAMQVMGKEDRIAVMVFDRQSRLRLPFRTDLDAVEREFQNVLNQETFDGGTDINRGLLDAARYIEREGRRDARRAIVILTDDQTERDRDEASVADALTRANTVLSAILAPDALGGRHGRIGSGGGGWPSSGGGAGGPLGDIIFGRRGPYGGRGGGSGPVIINRPRTTSAGTAEIAKRTGGDSMNVDDAGAFETTLSRIRQRYALHFNLPQGVEAGQEGDIEVHLADAAGSRYPGSEVRFRRMHASGDQNRAEPVTVSRTPTTSRQPKATSESSSSSPGLRRRRPAVNEDGTRIETPPAAASSNGGWRRSDEATAAPVAQEAPVATAPATATTPKPAETAPPQSGGWRRIKPGEQP